MLIERIASDAILDEAYAWLCRRRRDYPANTDIWWFRRNWASEKSRLQQNLLTNSYRFEALDRVTLKDGSTVDVWTSRDALALKAMTLCLADVLPALPSCTHIRGHGGAKKAVRQVAEHLPQHGFVLRTDVKSYYASIDHHLLLDRLAEHIADRAVLNLLSQYMRRSICDGGNYTDMERGISLGCPLSPLIAAFYLHELDEQFERTNLFYVRFMDDILILAPTRWKIRKAMAVVKATLSRLHLDTHPDKTFIGRIARGFDFLGYHFSRTGLRVARSTLRKANDHIVRLYEQKKKGPDWPLSLERYVRRWRGWVKGGLGGLPVASARLALAPCHVAQTAEAEGQER
jgi:RNA-directed DNA polymerase